MKIEHDTIAAIATAPGQGAIGIIRLSGKQSTDVLKRVFKHGLSGELASHCMYYGNIVDGDQVVDEVMVCPMFAPRSYTREDTVEIYAHGGMLVLNEVLKTVLKNGARLAEPGEFTKRAFLNGRLNLSQAEAVIDIINAGSTAAKKAALRQLGGGLSGRVSHVRDKILSWLAHIELSIDYPEHEEEARNAAEILGEINQVLDDLKALVSTAGIGRIFREGIKTAIIGKPNVGKSTLLNAILSEDRAIVHELPGTTRDVLTEQVRVGELHLVLTDTAGIRETKDPIEKIGVEKTKKTAEDADLILYIIDCTVGITQEDNEILSGLVDPVLIFNKADLTPEGLKLGVTSTSQHICISAKTGQGMDKLFSEIKRRNVVTGEESDIITRERHRILIEHALESVKKAKLELEMGVAEDLVSISLREAYLALGEVLGLEIGDDILDRIFSEFCVGK